MRTNSVDRQRFCAPARVHARAPRAHRPRAVPRSALRSVLRRCVNASRPLLRAPRSSRARHRQGPVRHQAQRRRIPPSAPVGRRRPARRNSCWTREAVLQHHGQPSVYPAAGRGRHPLHHFTLQHEMAIAQAAGHRREMKQQRGRDVVGQVADHPQLGDRAHRNRRRAHRPGACASARAGSAWPAPAGQIAVDLHHVERFHPLEQRLGQRTQPRADLHHAVARARIDRVKQPGYHTAVYQEVLAKTPPRSMQARLQSAAAAVL